MCRAGQPSGERVGVIRKRAATRRFARRLLAGLVAVCAGLGTWPAADAQAPAPSEYEVKAALLLNFARFTEWPESAFASPNAPLVIGVVGRDPFGPLLEKIFSNKTVGSRSIQVKRLSVEQDLKQCHLLFVPASEKRRQRDLLSRLKDASVLTVGDSDEFLEHGGAVRLLLKDGSVRFSIDLQSAKAARLRITSNVLRLADEVRGRYDD